MISSGYRNHVNCFHNKYEIRLFEKATRYLGPCIDNLCKVGKNGNLGNVCKVHPSMYLLYSVSPVLRQGASSSYFSEKAGYSLGDFYMLPV